MNLIFEPISVSLFCLFFVCVISSFYLCVVYFWLSAAITTIVLSFISVVIVAIFFCSSCLLSNKNDKCEFPLVAFVRARTQTFPFDWLLVFTNDREYSHSFLLLSTSDNISVNYTCNTFIILFSASFSITMSVNNRLVSMYVLYIALQFYHFVRFFPQFRDLVTIFSSHFSHFTHLNMVQMDYSAKTSPKKKQKRLQYCHRRFSNWFHSIVVCELQRINIKSLNSAFVLKKKQKLLALMDAIWILKHCWSFKSCIVVKPFKYCIFNQINRALESHSFIGLWCCNRNFSHSKIPNDYMNEKRNNLIEVIFAMVYRFVCWEFSQTYT